jgi:hypothetical protein
MESPARKWWDGIPEISVCAESAPVMCDLIPRIAPVLTGQDLARDLAAVEAAMVEARRRVRLNESR